MLEILAQPFMNHIDNSRIQSQHNQSINGKTTEQKEEGILPASRLSVNHKEFKLAILDKESVGTGPVKELILRFND